MLYQWLNLSQLAHVLKLQGNSRESLQTYERAFQLDETSVPALTGKTRVLCVNPQYILFYYIQVLYTGKLLETSWMKLNSKLSSSLKYSLP